MHQAWPGKNRAMWLLALLNWSLLRQKSKTTILFPWMKGIISFIVFLSNILVWSFIILMLAANYKLVSRIYLISKVSFLSKDIWPSNLHILHSFRLRKNYAIKFFHFIFEETTVQRSKSLPEEEGATGMARAPCCLSKPTPGRDPVFTGPSPGRKETNWSRPPPRPRTTSYHQRVSKTFHILFCNTERCFY